MGNSTHRWGEAKVYEVLDTVFTEACEDIARLDSMNASEGEKFDQAKKIFRAAGYFIAELSHSVYNYLDEEGDIEKIIGIMELPIPLYRHILKEIEKKGDYRLSCL